MEAREEYDKLVWPIMTSCRMFACWPEAEVPHWRLAHRGLVLLFLALMCFGASTEVAVFWGDDMNETIECSLVTSAFYMALLRVLVFASRQRDMLYIVETIKRDWTESSPEEQQLLRDECILAYKLAKFFIVSVAMTSIAFIAMPALEVEWLITMFSCLQAVIGIKHQLSYIQYNFHRQILKYSWLLFLQSHGLAVFRVLLRRHLALRHSGLQHNRRGHELQPHLHYPRRREIFHRPERFQRPQRAELAGVR